ncbi:MAG: SecDF P1 head subdomain-containing protein [Phycisphaerae bacterium]
MLLTAAPAGAQQAPTTRPATGPAVEGKIVSPTLTRALGQLIAELAVEYTEEGEDIELPPQEEIAAFAAAQEGLYVTPETEERFRAGKFDDDANAEQLRHNLVVIERYEVELPLEFRVMAEKLQGDTLKGAQLELAARITADAAKSIEEEIGEVTTRPAGSTLSFRIAPKHPEMGDSPLTEAEVARYVEHLTERGATGWPAADYQWFEVIAEDTETLVIHEHQGRKYVLLSNRQGETMLAGDGWGIEVAWVGPDYMNRPSVHVRFDEPGARKLLSLTRSNMDRHLAVIVDAKVYSVPVIRAAIAREASISGQFTQRQAAELAWALRVGMRPAKEPTTRPAEPETQPAREPRAAPEPTNKE